MTRRQRSKINKLNAAKSNGRGLHGEFWTDERLSTIKTMWGADEVADVIAAVIGNGCTRSMVIGKANRLNLAPRKEKKWRRWRELVAA